VIFLISAKDCFEKGLLKKTQKNSDLAKKSLRQANFFLDEAESLIDLEKQVMAAISLYSAYFHVARSLLYKDGIKERSHYCIARYVEEEYVNKKLLNIKFLNAFETIMNMRHNIQYSTETITIDEDLDELYNICLEFLNEVEKII